MFYNRAIKVSSSHNQSYTEIGSVYHGAYLSHILIVPPLRAYSGRGSVHFSSLVYFFYKTLFSFFFWANTSVFPYILFISIVYLFSSLCRVMAWCVRFYLFSFHHSIYLLRWYIINSSNSYSITKNYYIFILYNLVTIH